MNNSNQLHTPVEAGFQSDKGAVLRNVIEGTRIREEGIMHGVYF
jgi:hypothetical protein